MSNGDRWRIAFITGLLCGMLCGMLCSVVQCAAAMVRDGCMCVVGGEQ